MNKELLEPIMRAHGDKNKDLAAAIGMSVPNFSTMSAGPVNLPSADCLFGITSSHESI